METQRRPDVVHFALVAVLMIGFCRLPDGHAKTIVCECAVTYCSADTSCESTIGCYAIQLNTGETERGCLQSVSQLELKTHCSAHGMKCCFNSSNCNGKLTPTLPPELLLTTVDTNPASSSGLDAQSIAIYCILGGLLLIVVAVIVVTRSYIRKKQARSAAVPGSTEGSVPNVEPVLTDFSRREQSSVGTSQCPDLASTMCTITDPEEDSLSESHSGKGQARLVQRTISRDLVYKHTIGAGKFGEVWCCEWQQREVAVKVSKSRAENEWVSEVKIYESRMVSHKNILGFIAADVCDKDNVIHRLIVTDYHRRGNLHCVLEAAELTIDGFLRLAVSAADGLTHLHSTFRGSAHVKAGMAHRDIKSKNILVKDDGEACICDLGLGVIYDPVKVKQTPFEVKRVMVGTRRYMSPEILTGSIDKYNFEEFKRADTYSFAMVLWEIARRCNYKGLKGGAQSYLEPFGDVVGDNPSYDDMRGVVIDKRMRPPIPSGWHDNQTMMEVERVCRTCWKKESASRLSMLRVSKNLRALQVSFGMKDTVDNGRGGGGGENVQTPRGYGGMYRKQPDVTANTESTRLEMWSPEQSSLSRPAPPPAIPDSEPVATGAQSTPADGTTLHTRQGGNESVSSRYFRYGPTEL